MDGNKKRPQIGRADSNMQSGSPDNTSSSAPLRSAVARPDHQEFNVGGPDFGGLPLDKAVKDTIKEGKKDPEPINQAHENFEHHVDVPLKKPTQTICSSMGGGRNAAPTEIGFGGPDGDKPKDDNPKEFVYRDEDFPTPTAASAKDSSPSDSKSSPSKAAPSDSKNPSPTAEPHGTNAAPYLGLDHSFFRKRPAKNNDDAPSSGADTPDMNLGSLFPESTDKPKAAPQQQKLNQIKKPLSRTNTPEMGLDKLFPDDAANKAPHHEPFNAQVHLIHPVDKNQPSSSSPLKSTPTRQDTPEMNLDKLFPEDSPSSAQAKKKPSSPLKDTPTRQDTPDMNLASLFPEDNGKQAPKKKPSSPLKDTPNRQDTPEMNLGTLFPESNQGSSQPKKKPSSPLKDTLTRQDTPEMNLNKLFPETSPNDAPVSAQHAPVSAQHAPVSAQHAPVSAQHAPHHEPFNAPAHLIHPQGQQHPAGSDTPDMNLASLFPEDTNQSPKKKPSSPLKDTPTRQDTPEMNLGSLFPEGGQSSSQPKKKPSSPLKDTPTRQDSPALNLNDLFKDQPAPSLRLPAGHAHAVPTHRPKKDSDKPEEDAKNDDPSDHHQHMRQPREPHNAAPKQQPNRQETPEMHLDALFPDESPSSSQPKKNASSPLKSTPTRQDTPEMNLNNLFPDESPSSSQPKKNASSPLKNTPTRQDTPEMNLNNLFPDESPSSSQPKKNASSPLKNTPTRQDTPEMNLDKLFPEATQSPSQPKKMPSSPLRNTPTRQDTPELGLDKLFPEEAANKPSQHEPFNAPAHLVHPVDKSQPSSSSPLKNTPTRQDTPEMNLGNLFPEENSQAPLKPNTQSSPLKNVIERHDTPEMHLDDLFPESSSSSSQPKQNAPPKSLRTNAFGHPTPASIPLPTSVLGTPKMAPEDKPTISSGQQAQHGLNDGKVELLPEPSHSSVHVSHGIALPTSGDSSKPISISLEDLLKDDDSSDSSPFDLPISGKPTPATVSHPFFSQPSSDNNANSSEMSVSIPEMPSHNGPVAAPSAPSLPSIHAPSISMPHLPSLPQLHAPSMPSISLPSFGAKKANKTHKPSKRSRKADRKNEAKRQASMLDSLSSAIVGRRKNSVSSPVMRLNELFDEPSDLTLPAAASSIPTNGAAAPRMGGIRNMLPSMPSIHMPHMPSFARQPAEPKLDTTSASSSATAEPKVNKHEPSKAAALKMPKIDPTLLPEEQASYPRGGASRHENPAPSHVEDMLEVKEIKLPKSNLLDTSISIGAIAAAPQLLEHQPSTAAALKKPKIDPTLFPEEQADYPRGSLARINNPAPSNVEDIVEIKKIPALPAQIHRHPVPVFRAHVPLDEKKRGKRARKAQRKHEATLRHSIMDTISTALVGRRKNSVSSPVMRLNELFDEPSALALPAPAGSRVGGIRNMLPSMPAMPTVRRPSMPEMHLPEVHVPTVHLPTLPEMHLPSLPAMPTLTLPQLPKLSSATTHDVSGPATLAKHEPSTAAALKLPTVDLALLPEEQANYPRGDTLRRENPLPSHVEDIVEVEKVHYKPPEPSKAAAIKVPKADLTLLPEEQASYPRGDTFRRENPRPSHVEDIVEVKEIHVPVVAASNPVVKSKFVPSEHHSRGIEIQSIIADDEENYYSADDEPASITPRKNIMPISVLPPVQVETHKTVVTEPARVIPKVMPAVIPVVLQKTVVTEPVRVIPKVTPVEVPIITQKTVVTEPARVIPKVAPVEAPVITQKTVVTEPARVIPKVAPVEVPVITKKTVVTEPARVIPKVVPVEAPVITQKTVVTEPARVIPKSTVPIATPPVEVKKIPIAQPPVETKKIAIAQPPVEVKKIPIAQPPVVTKTTVTTTTTPAPAVPKIEIAKPPVHEIKEIKEVKVVTAPKPESNVSSARKPSAAELYANEHRVVVEDTKLADKIAHAPRPVIPTIVETKKTVIETPAPKIIEAPKIVEEHHHKAAPVPAPRPETTTTKTTVTTTTHTDPIPAPRPAATVVAAAPIASTIHQHHHKEAAPAPAPVQMEQQTTRTTRTTVVEPIPQPVQQIQEVKRVVKEVVQQPQPQIQQHYQQQQQTIVQQTAPVAALFDSGERTMLVKKLYTTVEYYDSEDEDELDEFGYRKDRDVSLHMAPMPTAQTRRNSLQAYRSRKSSGVSSLEANIAALKHQDVLANGGRPGLSEPLQQQHPHFYEQTQQVYHNPNQQTYVMQIPMHDGQSQQRIVSQQQYNSQPLVQPYQPQHQQQFVQQQQQYNTQPHTQQQQQYHQQQPQQQQQYYQQQPQVSQQQQYHQTQNQTMSQQQQHQHQHYSQSQPIYQPKQAYQHFQEQQQMQQQQQPGIRVGGEYHRGPAQ
ncbi:hypothetical protein EC991_005003 [Linnemannia zychae]|nr:hypothetical protein EC991_005003 [Linnemannia zychae]